MLNLLEPSKFGSYDSFVEAYGDMQSAEQAEKLVELLRPYLLRRTKDDVNLGEQSKRTLLWASLVSSPLPRFSTACPCLVEDSIPA